MYLFDQHNLSFDQHKLSSCKVGEAVAASFCGRTGRNVAPGSLTGRSRNQAVSDPTRILVRQLIPSNATPVRESLCFFPFLSSVTGLAAPPLFHKSTWVPDGFVQVTQHPQCIVV